MIIAIPTNNKGTFSEVPTRAQNAVYTELVASAGFTPILVPIEADPKKVAAMADGLLLAGGIDIDPIYYGFSNTASVTVDPKKDASERALLHAFGARKKRVFGICRGMQLIFREFMDSLTVTNDPAEKYFDYTENIGGHSQTSGLHLSRKIASHYVEANLGRLYSNNKDTVPERLPVNSMHHQACIFNHGALALDTMSLDKQGILSRPIDMSKPLVTKVATTVGDFHTLAWSLRSVDMPKNKNDFSEYWSIIEAFEFKNKTGGNFLAVQWHPEELKDVSLFKNFFLQKPTGKTIKQQV